MADFDIVLDDDQIGVRFVGSPKETLAFLRENPIRDQHASRVARAINGYIKSTCSVWEYLYMYN